LDVEEDSVKGSMADAMTALRDWPTVRESPAGVVKVAVLSGASIPKRGSGPGVPFMLLPSG
jgi:hypothetical protein